MVVIFFFIFDFDEILGCCCFFFFLEFLLEGEVLVGVVLVDFMYVCIVFFCMSLSMFRKLLLCEGVKFCCNFSFFINLGEILRIFIGVVLERFFMRSVVKFLVRVEFDLDLKYMCLFLLSLYII